MNEPGRAVADRQIVARVVAALGDLVEWYCTINEPGAVALGCVGALGYPPGTTDLGS
jgi:hypothetical protein